MISLYVLVVCSAKQAIGNEIVYINGLHVSSLLLVYLSLLQRASLFIPYCKQWTRGKEVAPAKENKYQPRVGQISNSPCACDTTLSPSTAAVFAKCHEIPIVSSVGLLVMQKLQQEQIHYIINSRRNVASALSLIYAIMCVFSSARSLLISSSLLNPHSLYPIRLVPAVVLIKQSHQFRDVL